MHVDTNALCRVHREMNSREIHKENAHDRYAIAMKVGDDVVSLVH